MIPRENRLGASAAFLATPSCKKCRTLLGTGNLKRSHLSFITRDGRENSPEWENDWWKEKLRVEVRPTIMRRFLEDTE